MINRNKELIIYKCGMKLPPALLYVPTIIIQKIYTNFLKAAHFLVSDYFLS